MGEREEERKAKATLRPTNRGINTNLRGAEFRSFDVAGDERCGVSEQPRNTRTLVPGGAWAHDTAKQGRQSVFELSFGDP